MMVKRLKLLEKKQQLKQIENYVLTVKRLIYESASKSRVILT